MPTHRGATTFEVDKMAFEMKKRAWLFHQIKKFLKMFHNNWNLLSYYNLAAITFKASKSSLPGLEIRIYLAGHAVYFA